MNILTNWNGGAWWPIAPTAPELQKRLESGPSCSTAASIPTADSLHVGNLVPLLALRRFQLLGHHPIAVAGGATGLVGDPSGRTAERQLLSRETLDANIARIKDQLRRLLDFERRGQPGPPAGQRGLDARR